FCLIKQANVKKSLITHLSNRYNYDEIDTIRHQLKAKENVPHFEFVKDFDTFKI
ncbi:ribonuclease Z, partial [Staphylococcus aureus]|nr:ribonuclease Z [Staphylococcus aureus]